MSGTEIDNQQRKKKKESGHGATDWNIRGQEEATQQRAPWTGTSGGTQWQVDKRTEPGLEDPGKKVPAGNRATPTGSSRGAEAGYGDHQRQEEWPWKGESRRRRRSGTEGDNRQLVKQEGERRKARCHGLEHPGPGKSHTAMGPPGLEHPGERRGKRTSTRSPDWNFRGRKYRPATGPPSGRKSGRPVKDNMNKSKERKGEETKNKDREETREGDEGSAQNETTGRGRRKKKVGTVRRTGASGARKKPHSNEAPWTGTSRGTQWQADKRTEPGLEHPGKKRHLDWIIRGAEALDWNIRGRSGPGLERPALHKEEEARRQEKARRT